LSYARAPWLAIGSPAPARSPSVAYRLRAGVPHWIVAVKMGMDGLPGTHVGTDVGPHGPGHAGFAAPASCSSRLDTARRRRVWPWLLVLGSLGLDPAAWGDTRRPGSGCASGNPLGG
jgi:hypothetical protein